MIQKNILLVGPSGSGKTHFVNTLKAKHPNIYSADSYPGLAAWVDGHGNRVENPDITNRVFLDTHEWLWDRVVLEKLLNEKGPLILAGLSGNAFEMLDLFDATFCLDVSNEVLLDRLQHESRQNPFGNTKEQRDLIIEYAVIIRKNAKQNNVPLIDGEKSPEEILKVITRA